MVKCLREHRYTGAVTQPMLTSECEHQWMLSEIPKIGLEGNKKYTKQRWMAFLTNPHFVCNIYKTVCLQELLLHGL